MAPNVDESLKTDEQARDYVSRMSNEKYRAVSVNCEPADIVLTADTIVIVGDEILGKPIDSAQGEAMLRQLSGSSHRVMTSVSLGRKESDVQQFVVETIVQFRTLTNSECAAYWRTGEPQDKAGGYGIQGIGAMFIESITGSYTNVVGLPLTETAQRLQLLGIEIL